MYRIRLICFGFVFGPGSNSIGFVSEFHAFCANRCSQNSFSEKWIQRANKQIQRVTKRIQRANQRIQRANKRIQKANKHGEVIICSKMSTFCPTDIEKWRHVRHCSDFVQQTSRSDNISETQIHILFNKHREVTTFSKMFGFCPTTTATLTPTPPTPPIWSPPPLFVTPPSDIPYYSYIFFDLYGRWELLNRATILPHHTTN